MESGATSQSVADGSLEPTGDGAATTGTTNDAAPDGTASADGSSNGDAGTDASDARIDTGPPDAGGYRCGMTSTYVADCTSCPGNPLLCLMCGAAGAREYICVPKGSSCEGDYRTTGYDYCPCTTGDAAACILPLQECNPFNGGVCVTCGEVGTGYACKRGGTCNQTTATCN
jgi:hypothetical protein